MKTLVKKIFKFFLYLAAFLVIIVAALYFCRNIILDAVIEKGGAKINKAAVDVYDVNLDIFSQSVSWSGLEAADKNDPWKNLFETGYTEFGFELMPLTGKKIIINSMVLKDLQAGTKRETSGKLPETEKTKDKGSDPWVKDFALKQLEKEKEQIPVLNPELFKDFENTDKIIEKLDLVTPQKVEEAEKYINERKEFWEKRFEQKGYKDRIKELEKDFKAISFDKDQSPVETAENISKVRELIDKARQLKKDIEKDKALAEKDINQIKNYRQKFPQWIKQDYAKAEKAVRLEGTDLKNIPEILFGKRLAGIGEKLFQMISDLRNNAEKTVADEKKTAEKTDTYPHLPSLWIKNADFSMQISDNNLKALKGNIKNISSDQNKTELPITFTLGGLDEKYGDINADGVIDYRKDAADINISLDVKDFLLEDFQVSSAEFFPLIIKKGKLNLSSDIVSKPELLKASADITVKDHIFSKKDETQKSSEFAGILLNALQSAQELNIKVFARLAGEKKDISLKSSVDSLVSDEISSYLGQKADKAANRLKKKLDEKLQPEKQKLISKSGNAGDFIMGNISGYEKEIENKQDRIEKEKKELEKKAEDRLEKKGKELLDKLDLKF